MMRYIVGTTIRNTDIPEHILADEHHQPRKEDMICTYLFTNLTNYISCTHTNLLD
jgi:hypothetical protein